MKLACRSFLPFTVLFVTVPVQSGGAQTVADGHGPAPLAGTYEVRICRAACDLPGERADRVEGRLVLENATYPWTSIPEPGRNYAFRNGRFLLVRGRTEEDPNACFVLRRTPGSRILAGYPSVGFTAWRPKTSSEGFMLRLSQTPDASYVLDLRVSGREMKARGVEYGPHGTETLFDSVTMTWIGPPDRSICTAIAMRGASLQQATDSISRLVRTRFSSSVPGGVAGTYELEICPDKCRRGWRRAVRGRVVLEDTAFRVNRLTAAVRRYAVEKSRDLLIMAGSPNACFVLQPSPGASTFVGKQPIGFTRWSAVEPAGTLRIDLFAADEGEYTARVTLAGDRLTGEGWSLVKGPFGELIPSDVIRGRRVGPPDRALCERAAERAAADLPPER